MDESLTVEERAPLTPAVRLVSKEAPTEGIRPGPGPDEIFIAGNPSPRILSIEPTVLGQNFCAPLWVRGEGFIPESVLLVDGVEVARPFSDPSLLLTRFSSAGLSPGEHAVQVRNPRPGGGLSAPISLWVE